MSRYAQVEKICLIPCRMLTILSPGWDNTHRHQED